MKPLTDICPKPLLPLFHEPMIFHSMKRFKASGIRNFIINTHHLHEKWNNMFEGQYWNDCRISLSNEPVLLDSGGGLANALDLIEPSSSLLVHNGDIVTSLNHELLMDCHRRSKSMVTLALRSNGCLNNVGFDQSTGLVTDIRNSLGISTGTHEFAGIYCIEPEIIGEIPKGKPYSIINIFIELIKKGQIQGVVLDEGYWYNVGDIETYQKLHMDFLNKKYASPIHPQAHIAPTAVIDQYSIIGKNASVGDYCSIQNSIIWPDVSIPQDSTVKNQILFK